MVVVVLVFLLSLISETLTCLQCDSSIQRMHDDFIRSRPRDTQKLTEISRQVLDSFKQSSKQLRGVIDPTTLYRAKTKYQNEFKNNIQSLPSDITGAEVINIMDKGRMILEEHLKVFIREGLCPNKCGLLKRRVMDCISCRYKSYICPAPQGRIHCGEYPVPAEEEGQAVLNCFLPWHRLLLGTRLYHYSWAPGLPGSKQPEEIDFIPLVVTPDSSLVLNQLQTEEQGTYRCSLQNQNGTIFYTISFLLTVALLPTQILPPLPTHPFLIHGDHSPLASAEGLLPVIALITALSLATSIGLAVFLGKKIHQKAVKKKLRSRTTEGHPMKDII